MGGKRTDASSSLSESESKWSAARGIRPGMESSLSSSSSATASELESKWVTARGISPGVESSPSSSESEAQRPGLGMWPGTESSSSAGGCTSGMDSASASSESAKKGFGRAWGIRVGRDSSSAASSSSSSKSESNSELVYPDSSLCWKMPMLVAVESSEPDHWPVPRWRTSFVVWCA
jgi:hypothetical protein